MNETFKSAVAWLLLDETGPESKNDPSRKINRFGLSLELFKKWTGKDEEEFKKLTSATVEQLYRHNIWLPVSGDALPRGLDYFMFDGGYRFGCATILSWWRLSLNLHPAVPLKIVLDVGKNRTTRDIILNIDVFIRRRLKSEPLWDECKHWWTNRANRVRDRAVKLTIVDNS